MCMYILAIMNLLFWRHFISANPSKYSFYASQENAFFELLPLGLCLSCELICSELICNELICNDDKGFSTKESLA